MRVHKLSGVYKCTIARMSFKRSFTTTYTIGRELLENPVGMHKIGASVCVGAEALREVGLVCMCECVVRLRGTEMTKMEKSAKECRLSMQFNLDPLVPVAPLRSMAVLLKVVLSIYIGSALIPTCCTYT